MSGLNYEIGVKINVQNAKNVFDNINKQAENAGKKMEGSMTVDYSKITSPYERLNAILKENQNIASSNSISEMKDKYKEAGKEVEFLESQLVEMSKAISDLDGKIASVNKRKINIQSNIDAKKANSADPLSIQVDESVLKQYNAQLDVLSQKQQDVKRYMEEYSGELERAKEQYNQLGEAINSVSGRTNSLVSSMNKARQRMAELKSAGQEGSEEYKLLSKELSSAKTSYVEVNKEMANLSKKGITFQATIQGLNLLSGAFSTTIGAMSMFGVEQDKVAKVQTTLQSAIAITNGLQSVYLAIQKESALMTGFAKVQTALRTVQELLLAKAIAYKTTVEVAGTKATNSATIAMKAFNAVAKSSPILLIISALALLAGAIYGVVKAVSNHKKEQEALRKEIEETLKQYEKLTDANKKILEIEEARGKSSKELRKLEREQLVEELKFLKNRQEAIKGKKMDEETRKEYQGILDLMKSKLKEIKDVDHKHTLQVIKEAKARSEAEKSLLQETYEARMDLEKRKTSDRKKQIAIDLKLTLEGIEREKQAYIKEYGDSGDISKALTAFANRSRIAREKANIELSEIDKDIRKFLNESEEELYKLKVEVDFQSMRNVIDLLDDEGSKIKINTELLQRQNDERERAFNIETRRNIEEQFGETEAEKYNKGEKLSKETQEYVNTRNQQNKAENRKTELAIQQMTIAQELKNYQEYANRVLAIEKWKQERLKELQEQGFNGDGYSRYEKQIQDNANQQIKLARVDTGVSEEVVQSVMSEIQSIIEMTKEQLLTLLTQTHEEIATLEEEIANTSNEGERVEKTKKLVQLQGQLKRSTELYNTVLVKTGNSVGNNTKKAKEWYQEFKEDTDVVIDCFGSVIDVCDELSDMLGGTLSDNGKLALDTVKTVSQASISVITAIQGVAQVATQAMSATEKASVILTVISAVIQAAMAVASFITQNLTKEAKLKKEIDSLHKKMEDVQHEHTMFEKSFKTAQGTKYWKEQANAVRKLDDQLEIANKEIEKQEELLAEIKRKYGEDSEKYEEQEKEYKTSLEQQQDILNDQVDGFREIMEELSGTSLEDFSGNLADSMIDGFLEGTQLMEDIWNETIDDLVVTMMKSKLSLALEDMYKPIFDKLQKSTEDGVLSNREMMSFINDIEQTEKRATDLSEQYFQLMKQLGVNADVAMEAEKKGFEGMSQDTADELNGRFTALQMSGSALQLSTARIEEMLAGRSLYDNEIIKNSKLIAEQYETSIQISNNILQEVRQISDNTTLLAPIEERLRRIEENTARL